MAIEEPVLLANDKGWGCADSCNVFVIIFLSLKHLLKHPTLAEGFLSHY